MTTTDYFKVFCKVSKAFGTTLKKADLLNLIVGSAIDTMDGKGACLYMADEEEDIFIPVAQKGLSENYLHAPPMKARKIVDGILDGGHLSIFDATSDPRVENHELKKKEGIASILVVPVMVNGKTTGILSLYTPTQRDFSTDEIDFLSALAEQGGIAVQHARLFERINQSAMLFLDLASSINSSLDIKKILHIMSAEVGESIGFKGVSIRLYNPNEDAMNVVASYGLSEEFISLGHVSPKDSKTVAQVLNGETVIVKDIANDPRFKYKEEALKEGIRSMLCVPIKSGDEVIGEMRMCSATKREFPEDVIILANALGHQGGIAIRNASSYLALEEAKKNLEQDIWSHKSWF